jgi:hypothetical protein
MTIAASAILTKPKKKKFLTGEEIGKTVTHCRFEATDPEADEVVLMLILKVPIEESFSSL